MKYVLLAALGGALGTAGRYAVNVLLGTLSVSYKFPLGTFAVNLLGSLVIGFVTAIAENNTHFSEGAKVFIVTGVLGGFTTFSALTNETILLARDGSILYAFINVAVSLVTGLGAVLVGYSVGRLLFR